ncbi:S-adenosyl-L-methionine-dependent methyltransferase [Auricularia subglabra TFB-10046 SS5]|nr:S-adenosyl-L-methionine-dependent methyltransferase [Auricularia subglabra TFB-10046 SS5]
MSKSIVDSKAHLLELAALINQSVATVLAEYDAAGLVVPGLESTEPSETLVNRAIRDAVCVLEGACAQLCASAAPATHIMANMINPACIRVALTARAAEHLRDGPRPVSELAALAGMDADKLGRVLRNLSTKHCFREVSKGVYANNKLSVCLLPEDTTSGLIGHFVDEIYAGLGSLSDVLADPEWKASTDKDRSAFVRAHKMSVFEMAAKDRFPRAMLGWTKLNGGAGVIAEVSEDATFCDLGGSVGHVAMALTKAHPRIRAVVQDLPPVIEQAQQIWEKEAPDALACKRVELVPVDFLADAPAMGCDFYYVHCTTILNNVRKAMTKPNTKVLIHECSTQFREYGYKGSADEIILTHTSAEDQHEGYVQAPFPMLPNYGIGAQRKYNQDINMLAGFNSRERTLDEFIALGATAGLRLIKVWEAGDTTIVELKAS